MPTPPLQLDYARATYFVLSSPSSSSSSAPPQLPPSLADVRYLGPLGEGALANEHVVALEGVPSGSHTPEQEERVRTTTAALRAMEGISHVEVMRPAQRAKR
ncbi:hypothetical protein JCM3774_001820 [Rhodotorula dairenensis]